MKRIIILVMLIVGVVGFSEPILAKQSTVTVTITGEMEEVEAITDELTDSIEVVKSETQVATAGNKLLPQMNEALEAVFYTLIGIIILLLLIIIILIKRRKEEEKQSFD